MYVLFNACVGIGFVDRFDKMFIYYEKSFEMCTCSWQSFIVLRWPCLTNVKIQLLTNPWSLKWSAGTTVSVHDVGLSVGAKCPQKPLTVYLGRKGEGAGTVTMRCSSQALRPAKASKTATARTVDIKVVQNELVQSMYFATCSFTICGEQSHNDNVLRNNCWVQLKQKDHPTRFCTHSLWATWNVGLQ